MKHFITLMICLSCLISFASCASHPFPNTKEGEYPEKCIRAEFVYPEYEIAVGETIGTFRMMIPYMGLEHEEDSLQHIDVEFAIDNNDVIEIVSYDIGQLLNHNEFDGLTIKGLKPGTTTITMTFIYKPTNGRSYSSKTTVTVTDPAETAE